MEIPKPAKDQYGRPRLGGVGQYIAAEIERRTGIETGSRFSGERWRHCAASRQTRAIDDGDQSDQDRSRQCL
jgi:hypothetical protein